MQKQLVITVSGNDRLGLVEDVTKIVLSHHGNVDSSRMARLGGVFAMLMLVSVSEAAFDGLQEGINELRNQDFEVTVRQTERGFAAQKFIGWHSYQLNVNGADHEGIIHEVTHYLTEQGINIETADTSLRDAPFGGTALFTMTAKVVAPPNLTVDELQDELKAIGDQLNVDIEIEPINP